MLLGRQIDSITLHDFEEIWCFVDCFCETWSECVIGREKMVGFVVKCAVISSFWLIFSDSLFSVFFLEHNACMQLSVQYPVGTIGTSMPFPQVIILVVWGWSNPRLSSIPILIMVLYPKSPDSFGGI